MNWTMRLVVGLLCLMLLTAPLALEAAAGPVPPKVQVRHPGECVYFIQRPPFVHVELDCLPLP